MHCVCYGSSFCASRLGVPPRGAASSTSRRDAAAPRGGTRASRSISSVAAASAPSQQPQLRRSSISSVAAASATSQQQQLRRSSISRRRQCPVTMSGRRGEKRNTSSGSPSNWYKLASPRKAFFIWPPFFQYNKRLLRQKTVGACLYMPQDGHWLVSFEVIPPLKS